jgi:hypothetical protein
MATSRRRTGSNTSLNNPSTSSAGERAIPVTVCGQLHCSQSRLSPRASTVQRPGIASSRASRHGLPVRMRRPRDGGEPGMARRQLEMRVHHPNYGCKPPYTEQVAEQVCMEGGERPHPLAALFLHPMGARHAVCVRGEPAGMSPRGVTARHDGGRHTAQSGSVGGFRPSALWRSITTAHGCRPYTLWKQWAWLARDGI